MKYLIATLALVLSACATTSTPRQLAPDLYTISEMDIIGGDTLGHAASFCAQQGREMSIEGNTTQRGLASGTNYAVIVFRCA